MDAKKKVDIADILPLIDELKGNVANIAKRLGVVRQTIYNRIQESATLRTALQDAREAMLDNAESSLYSKVLQGDTTSIIFFLKTQGKKRGYVERVEVDNINASDLTDEQLETIVAGKMPSGVGTKAAAGEYVN